MELTRLCAYLEPAGLLVLGHSDGVLSLLHGLETVGTTIYRLSAPAVPGSA